MGSAIEFEFKGNLSQLRRDLAEAARLAKSAASDISRSTRDGFSGGAGSLFRRTPERRAERAFSEFGAGLLTGDVSGAIAGLTGKITAFGLAAGVGVGVAVELFQKFHKEINDTSSSFDALQQHLARPLGIQSGLGPDALTSEIEEGNKKLEDALAKRSSLGARLSEFLHRGTTAGQSDTRFGGERADTGGPDLATQRDKIIEESQKRQSQLAGLRADKELQIANLKLMSARGYEKEAALAKITLDAEEKRAALLLNRKGNALDLYKSNLAINTEAEAARLQAEKKFGGTTQPAAYPTYFHEVKPGTAGVMGGNDRRTDVRYSDGRTESFIGNMLQRNGGADLDESNRRYYQNLDNAWKNYDNWMGNGYDRTGGVMQPESKDIGTGIDGIKQGIDNLNTKMDTYWS